MAAGASAAACRRCSWRRLRRGTVGFGRSRGRVVRHRSRLFVHLRRGDRRRGLRQAEWSAEGFTLRRRRSRGGGPTPPSCATGRRHRRDVERRSATQSHRNFSADGGDREAGGSFHSEHSSRMRHVTQGEEAGEHNAQRCGHDDGSPHLRAGTSRRFANPASLDAYRVHEDGQTIGCELLGLRHMSTRTGSFPRRIVKPVYFPT